MKIFFLLSVVVLLTACRPGKIPDTLESAEIDSVRAVIGLGPQGAKSRGFLLSKRQTEEFCALLNDAREVGVCKYYPMITFHVFQENKAERFFRASANIIKEKTDLAYKIPDTLFFQKLFKQYFNSDTLP